MDLTTNQTQSLTFLGLGLAVALLTSLLKNVNWSSKQKHTAAVFLSIVGGYVSSYFQKNGTTDLTDITKHSAYAYAVSQLFYSYALKNTSVNAWLTKFNLLPGSKES